MNKLLEEYLARFTKKPHTYHLYKVLLQPFFVWAEEHKTDFNKIEYTEIDEFLDKRDAGPNTKSQTLNAIRRFLRWFIKTKSPWDFQTRYEARERLANISEYCKERTFSVERHALDISQMQGLFEISYKKQNDFIPFYLLGYFGMRIGEWRQIEGGSDEDNCIHVKTEKCYKKNPIKIRTLYFDEMTAELMKKGKGLLANTQKIENKCWRYRNVYKKLTPHIFRYTFNTHMRRRVPTEKVLHYLMGHYDANLTNLYDDVFEHEKKEMMLSKHYYNDIPFVQSLQKRWEQQGSLTSLGTF